MKNLLLAVSVALFVQQVGQSIEPPPGARLVLEAKGEGAQVYTCTNSQWVLKAPNAKLLDASGQVIGSHFAGPTWRLIDGSEVTGKVIASQPAPDGKSIPWLLVGAAPGNGSGKFADVRYIRRTETTGGAPPKEPCTTGELPVPYAAKYSFYASK
jgi:Protein of unknown function (DUF3455)